MQSFFGFGQTADIAIELVGADKRKQVEVKNEDGKRDKLFLYYDGESITGKVLILLSLDLQYLPKVLGHFAYF